MAEIKKILIANRGEIAVRIARACRDAGITSVAVYSDPDRTAFHVRCADEAYPLGGTTSAETYLVQEKIINAAKECGAEAIHPGYGFLAENHKFAELCVRNDIIFIGPSSEKFGIDPAIKATFNFSIFFPIFNFVIFSFSPLFSI